MKPFSKHSQHQAEDLSHQRHATEAEATHHPEGAAAAVPIAAGMATHLVKRRAWLPALVVLVAVGAFVSWRRMSRHS